MRNLQPYPEPEKTRFWRRLRRLARVRRRPAAAAWSPAGRQISTAMRISSPVRETPSLSFN